ncbi:MAG: hypothetical protein ACRCXZ_03570 [Patescibacteria group bacterium]
MNPKPLITAGVVLSAAVVLAFSITVLQNKVDSDIEEGYSTGKVGTVWCAVNTTLHNDQYDRINASQANEDGTFNSSSSVKSFLLPRGVLQNGYNGFVDVPSTNRQPIMGNGYSHGDEYYFKPTAQTPWDSSLNSMCQ